MEADVIILSNTKTEELFKILKQTVDSLHDREPEHTFNVLIIESNKELSSTFTDRLAQIRGKFIIPKVDFNYNQFLNIGLRECKSDYIVISNNDIVYYDNWFTNILKQFEKDPKLMSAAPIDRKWHRHSEEHFSSSKEIHIGFRTSYELPGWCFVVKKEVFKILGTFDERFKFYYQDNDWAELYRLHNVKHGLCTTSHIHHLLSKSHNLLTGDDRKLYNMNEQHKVFSDKWQRVGNKRYKRLSLLICTIEGREHYLQRLVSVLGPQVTNEVEVLVSKDNKQLPIGKKRNDLIHQAIGEYIAFIDDDDWVSEDYISNILKATDSKPDVVGFNSIIIFNGSRPRRVEITLNHSNWSHKMGKIDNEDHPVIYYRCPNHLSPIKKSIAMSILFPEIADQEDRYYSLAIPSFAKNEVYIDKYMYFYDCKAAYKNMPVTVEQITNTLNKEKEYVELAESYIKMNV